MAARIPRWPRADRAYCVIVVSDAVYRGLIKQGYRNLNPSTYAELSSGAGWLRVPGYPIPPLPEAVTPSPVPGRPDTGSTVVRGNYFAENTIQQLVTEEPRGEPLNCGDDRARPPGRKSLKATFTASNADARNLRGLPWSFRGEFPLFSACGGARAPVRRQPAALTTLSSP